MSAEKTQSYREIAIVISVCMKMIHEEKIAPPPLTAPYLEKMPRVGTKITSEVNEIEKL